MSLIRIIQLRPWYTLRPSESIVINTDAIKKIEPINRNYTEEVSRIYFKDGEVIDSNEYFSRWTETEKR